MVSRTKCPQSKSTLTLCRRLRSMDGSTGRAPAVSQVPQTDVRGTPFARAPETVRLQQSSGKDGLDLVGSS